MIPPSGRGLAGGAHGPGKGLGTDHGHVRRGEFARVATIRPRRGWPASFPSGPGGSPRPCGEWCGRSRFACPWLRRTRGRRAIAWRLISLRGICPSVISAPTCRQSPPGRAPGVAAGPGRDEVKRLAALGPVVTASGGLAIDGDGFPDRPPRFFVGAGRSDRIGLPTSFPVEAGSGPGAPSAVGVRAPVQLRRPNSRSPNP